MKVYIRKEGQGAEKEKLVDGSSVHFPTAGRFKFPTLFFTSSSVSDNVRLIQHLYIYIYNPIEIIGFYARKKEKEKKLKSGEERKMERERKRPSPFLDYIASSSRGATHQLLFAPCFVPRL